MQQIAKSDIANLNKWHAEMQSLGAQVFERAMKSGKTLTEIKAKLGWGNYLNWLEKNLSYDRRTACRYMDVWEYAPILKRDNVSHLSTAYKLIANLKEFDKVASERSLTSYTKAKIKKKITADIDNVERYVDIATPDKEKKAREQSEEELRQKRYIENQFKEAVSLVNKAGRNLDHVRHFLKNENIVELPMSLQWQSYLFRRAMKSFLLSWKEFLPYIEDVECDEEEVRTKKIEVTAITTTKNRKVGEQ